MPLPSFLQRFRQGAQEPASGAVPMSSADVEQARVKARRRLVGMVVLVVAGVIGFPWLFETQPRPMSGDVQVVAAAGNRASGVVVQSAASGPAPAIASVTPPSPAPQRVQSEEPKEEFIEDKPVEPARPASKPTPAKKPVDKPAEKAPAKTAADKPAEKPVVAAKAASKPAAKPVAAAASAPKGKASAPTAATKTAAAPSKPATDTGSDRYIVQVGAFADVSAAREVRLKVERLGIKTYTQEVTTDGTKKVRVRVGPFASKAEADKAAASLRKAGLTGAVLTL